VATRSLYYLTEDSFRSIIVHELNKDGTSRRQLRHIEGDTVGHCWAAGRLKPGDILLCDALSGDGFYDWYLIDYTNYANRPGVQMQLVPYKFGAYAMPAKKLDGFTTRDYGLLLAGLQVEVMTNLPA
jgi:hypothetical protein